VSTEQKPEPASVDSEADADAPEGPQRDDKGRIIKTL